MNKGGRPKLTNEERKTNAVGFRCTDEELNKLQEKAKQTGLTVGEYCREVALKKKKLRPIVQEVNLKTYTELGIIGRNINQYVKKNQIKNKNMHALLKLINKIRLEVLGVQKDDTEHS
jgi:hypothetical protein